MLQQIASPPPALAEVIVNENFDALAPSALFGRRAAASSGLTWAYHGGTWGGVTVADGAVTLSNGTNYVVAARGTGVVSTSTSTTNWNSPASYARLYVVTAASSVVTAYVDHRAGQYGPGDARISGRAISSKSAAYTLTAADAETTIMHASADTTARTFTIPANSSVPYPVGTELQVVNQNGAGTITIAITSDTMRLAGAGTTGSRTLAANGIATAKKIATTEWLIYGWGLT